MSQGKTIDDALNNIKDAIQGWLEVEKQHGRLNLIEEKEVFLARLQYKWASHPIVKLFTYLRMYLQ